MKGISVDVGAMPSARISSRWPPVPSAADQRQQRPIAAGLAVRAAASMSPALSSSSGVTMSMPTRPVQKCVV